MQPQDYLITEHEKLYEGVYRLRLAPKGGGQVFPFKAGQFVQLQCAKTPTPQSWHSFSMSTSSHTRDYIETCYRVYGPWTQTLATLPICETIAVRGPFGMFVWDGSITSAVFLAGGVGMVPMFSMIKYIITEGQTPKLTMLYGSRTATTIAYGKEVEDLLAKLPNSKLVHVLSDAAEDKAWQGRVGFVTKEVIAEEVVNLQSQTYFLCGPPVFVELQKNSLEELGVPANQVKFELFSIPPAPKT